MTKPHGGYEFGKSPGEDISMRRFGSLTAIEYRGKNKHGQIKWLFLCDCGGEKVTVVYHVLYGLSTSCGCRRKAMLSAYSRSHGMSHTRLYSIRGGMLSRCNNPNSSQFSDYGGRGITVCDEWSVNPSSFISWALSNGYEQGLSIDRIDNEQGYSPENCRWATRKQQARNTRKKLLFTDDGQLWSEVAQSNGIKRQTFFARLARGWTIQKAATKPTRV